MSSTQLCPSLPEDEREALEAGWNEHPGLRHLGVRVDLSAPDVVRVYVDPVQLRIPSDEAHLIRGKRPTHSEGRGPPIS